MRNKRLMEIPQDARDHILKMAETIYEQDKLIKSLGQMLKTCSDDLHKKSRKKLKHEA